MVDDGIFYGLLDHTKMALCMFVLTAAFINPFSVWKGYSNSFQDLSHSSGRTILNAHGWFYFFISLVLLASELIETGLFQTKRIRGTVGTSWRGF